MNFFDVWLYFANGLFLKAQGFGKRGTITGEVVFNTSLTGYQEIISDPSYAGQFIVFCMPEIGIVGCNEKDMESSNIFAKGILVRRLSKISSNFRATQSLHDFFEKYGSMGICDIDTRGIVKTLRDSGSMMMIVSSEISTKEELESILKKSKKIEEIDYIEQVSTKETYIHKEANFNFDTFDYKEIDTHDSCRKKIVAIDYGIKRNILNELSEVGFIVEVVPQSFLVDDIISRFNNKEIHGVFLSNGPGDPALLQNQIDKIKKMIDANIPMFGICLGHQLLSNAFGYDTYKLKFGQHGGNHPVKNMQTNELEITAQNHNYNVPESISDIAIITHRNLFDNTIEGVEYKNYKIFSVQHHPESSPGPKESNKIFHKFIDMIARV